MTALVFENVARRRGDRVVVDNVSLEIAAGERVALLGHNGAGKTTLMRMALGLTPLDGGAIRIAGFLPGSMAALQVSSFLPENVVFHRALSGREQLRHFARLREVASEEVDDLLETAGLGADAHRRIATYSKGMRQRLGLAQALLGRPRVVLLDEPGSGLDPVARWQFYDLIDALAKDGVAVLVSSHTLTELEARTDRVAILRAGKLVANDSLDALRRMSRLPTRMRIVAKPVAINTVAAAMETRHINGRAVELCFDHRDKMERLMRINELRDVIEDVEVIPPNLDDLYRHFSVVAQEDA